MISSALLCHQLSSQPLGENSKSLYPSGSSKALSPPGSKEISTVIPPELLFHFTKYGKETGVSVNLMANLAMWESGFSSKKTNYNPETKWHPASIDVGLFMLNSECLEEFSLKYNGGKPINPHDPETSIRVAFRYMKVLQRIYGNDRMALIAWNGAMVFVKKNLKLPYGTRRLLQEVLGE